MENSPNNNMNSSDIPYLIKNLTERYNFLAQLSENISNEIKKRDFDVNYYNNEVNDEFEMLRQMLDNLSKMLENAEIEKKVVASEFRYIVKKDALERLSRKIDDMSYEQILHRRELDKYF